jgi:hypothetical protein
LLSISHIRKASGKYSERGDDDRFGFHLFGMIMQPQLCSEKGKR